MRITMVSEHASPLAAPGGVDTAGPPDRVPPPGGAVVEHVPAEAAGPVPRAGGASEPVRG